MPEHRFSANESHCLRCGRALDSCTPGQCAPRTDGEQPDGQQDEEDD